MKNSRAPLAALLISAHLLAAVCAASEPAVRVGVDAGRRVSFGQEQVGTCDDLGPLKERVRRAVKMRGRAARARGGKKTAASAGTVFIICASPDSRYEDVVKVIDAVKQAGGKSVGLSTDCDPPR